MTTAYHELNLLFLVVLASIWGVYSNDPYPISQIRPDTNQPYANIDPIQNQMITDQWAVTKKYFEEDQNKNKGLTKRFLNLLPIEHRRGYQQILIGDPNRKFIDTLLHFYGEFGHENEIKIEENKDAIKNNRTRRTDSNC